MDVKQFDTVTSAEQGFDLVVLDAHGNDTEIVITVLGADSEIYRGKLRAQRRKLRDRFNRTRKLEQSEEEMEADAIELIVAATTGWINIEMDGKPLEFSAENARRLYRKFPVIREQVDRAIGDRSNFLPSAAKPS